MLLATAGNQSLVVTEVELCAPATLVEAATMVDEALRDFDKTSEG